MPRLGLSYEYVPAGGKPRPGSIHVSGLTPPAQATLTLTEYGSQVYLSGPAPLATTGLALSGGAHHAVLNGLTPLALLAPRLSSGAASLSLSGAAPVAQPTLGLSQTDIGIDMALVSPVPTSNLALLEVVSLSLSGTAPLALSTPLLLKTEQVFMSGSAPLATITPSLSVTASTTYLVRDGFGATPETGTRTLTGTSSVADGRASIPGSTAWKGVNWQAVTRANGLAMLARLIYADIQAGAGSSQMHSSVGLYTSAAPTDPAATASGQFIAAYQNGSEAGSFAGSTAAIQAVTSAKQISFDFVTILRDRGAISYLAANPTPRQIGARAQMVPVFASSLDATAQMTPAVWIRDAGAAVDEVSVRLLSEYPNWYLTAVVADDLSGSGVLGGSAAQVGGTWSSANVQRTATGAQRTAAGTHSVLTPTVDTGLIGWQLLPGTGYNIECRFRVTDGSNYWRLWFQTTGWQLQRIASGAVAQTLASGPTAMTVGAVSYILLHDNGSTLRFWQNGGRLDGTGPVASTTGNTNRTAGFALGETASRVQRFEMHPRVVTLPATLRLETPWAARATTSTPITEDFAGTGDMEGKTSTTGSVAWTRTVGTATLTRNGAGAALPGTVGVDTYYTAPYSATYVDMLLNRTASGTTMSDVASFATVIATDGTNILACRSFLHFSQAGTTEFEILYGPSGNTPIAMRVAMGLEMTPGGTQSFRFIVDITNGMCAILFNGEPVAEYRHQLTAITRVGFGPGVNDSGTAFLDFSVSI